MITKTVGEVVAAAQNGPAVAASLPAPLVLANPRWPTMGGVSIGHVSGPTGTLGCVVNKAGAMFILSNNHVIAACNCGKVGDAVVHPGPADKHYATPGTIAKLTSYRAISFARAGRNKVDAALAKVID